jgi:hypothetical protein
MENNSNGTDISEAGTLLPFASSDTNPFRTNKKAPPTLTSF